MTGVRIPSLSVAQERPTMPEVGTHYHLEREVGNVHDKYAILVKDLDGEIFGRVDKNVSQGIARQASLQHQMRAVAMSLPAVRNRPS